MVNPKQNMDKERKDGHIQAALNKNIESPDRTNGFEFYELPHIALPDFDYEKIDTKIKIFGKELKYPFMITALTGGTKESEKINKNLALACEKTGIALGLGSQKILFEEPEALETFKVRKEGPGILLIANLGIHHLKEYGPEKCKKIVELIEADCLALYLNPLHEAVQEGGTPRYSGLKKLLENFCKKVSFPVIIKETGNGIGKDTASELKNTGIAGIDVAGTGGTSCVMLEYYLTRNPERKKILEPFFNWGISTARSLLEVSEILEDIKIIASGGIRNGVDIAKSVALGADMAGAALPFLRPASLSGEEVEKKLSEFFEQLKIAMLCAGAQNLQDLKKISIKKGSDFS